MENIMWSGKEYFDDSSGKILTKNKCINLYL